jgi:hypothetical protein
VRFVSHDQENESPHDEAILWFTLNLQYFLSPDSDRFVRLNRDFHAAPMHIFDPYSNTVVHDDRLSRLSRENQR